jgi:hypothetical protein
MKISLKKRNRGNESEVEWRVALSLINVRAVFIFLLLQRLNEALSQVGLSVPKLENGHTGSTRSLLRKTAGVADLDLASPARRASLRRRKSTALQLRAKSRKARTSRPELASLMLRTGTV